MSFDAWPSGLPCGQVDFSLDGGVSSGGDVPDGLPAALGASTPGPFWRARVSNLPLLTAAQIAAARALEGRLDGGAAPVLINVCLGDLKPQVVGGATAAATLSSDAAEGATSLHLAMSGGYLPLRGGEWLGYVHADPVGERGYMVAAITGGTDAAPIVTITPPLRAAIASGQAVSFSVVKVPMRLTSGLDLPIELGRFGAIEADFEEWFEEVSIPSLRQLGLSPHAIDSAAPEDTFVGYLLNVTAGSTLTLTDDAGGRFKLVDNGDGTWSIVAGATATDYDVAASLDITVRETLGGYSNSPRDNVLAIDVELVLARHRAWRVFFPVNAGNGGLTAVTELEFAATAGGPDLSGGATPITGGSGTLLQAAAQAFDGNLLTTQWSRLATTNTWLGADWGPTAADWPHIEQARVRGSHTDPAASPGSGRIDWTDDDPNDPGATWTALGDTVTFGRAWVRAAERVIPFITPPAGEYWGWRLYVDSVSGGSRCYLHEMEIRDSLGVDQVPNGTADDTGGRVFASSSLGATQPRLLFDGRLDNSPWATFDTVGAFAGCFLPTPVACPVMAVTLAVAQVPTPNFGPHEVRLQGTYDNLTWVDVRHTIFSAWSLPETKTV